MNLTVIGCGGFIGSHLLDRLMRLPDVFVEGWDTATAKIQGHVGSPSYRLHRCKTSDPGTADELSDAISRCDVVVNLAAICNPSEYNTRPLDVIDANLFDIRRVIELCSAHGRWLIHFSTSEVYRRTIASYVPGNDYGDRNL